jgi:(1->4)-alpha-D-glucan 1-alpha-D-glucosylmutase
MTVPRATMRLQFHKGFTFGDAAALVGYFASLGVSHLYASPIMTARPGSMHGYDVVDPTRINPELGGKEGLRRLVLALRGEGMGLIVDIVPNHMAIGSANAWWMDVLAGGRSSRYAKYFDIDWEPDDPALHGKVLLPVLGRPYGEALAAGEITLGGDQAGTPTIRYFDHIFPLAAGSLDAVQPSSTFDATSARGCQRLHALLEAQHYRLAWWRSANDALNWRRFFDINELAAVRVEDDEVFEAVHATVFRLYAQGLIDGVRIDHIDGLSQPESYCRKLRARLQALEDKRPPGCAPAPAYVVVEKILGRDEALPKEWQVDGTTGYDFMDEINALQHDPAAEQPLSEWWHRVSGRPPDFDAEEETARRQILERSFSAQCESAVRALLRIAESDLATRDFPRPALRRCLTEILAHFPVYRIYAGVDRASQSDLGFLSRAVALAKTTCLPGDAWLVEVLGTWLSGKPIRPETDARQAVALARFQQLSAPLCAKAVEDTAFYRYGRLISRNDVGFDVRRFACSAADFHRKMENRAADFPRSMLTTATHDHKRGEDVRARLAVLSELPADWMRAVDRWVELSQARCAASGRALLPTAGDLAILLQTIVGAWPMGLTAADQAGVAAYGKRIAAWQQKALREAKLHTDWSAPNEGYERAAADLIAWLFSGSSELLPEIASFAQRITEAGAANGLAQLVVKLTAPGMPDIYQSTEYWDLSLVDPDNRAPVNFAARQESLHGGSTAKNATIHVGTGELKQWVTARILAVRKKSADLFSNGAYLPLDVEGPRSAHVVAFARTLGERTAITIVCRLTAHLLTGDGSLTIPRTKWSDTRLIVPPRLRAGFSEALRPPDLLSFDADAGIAQILPRLPVALLTNQPG